MFNMHRIVHLDLKGAPLKLPYFEKVILLAKSWGATSILVEWEDTFPYSSELTLIGSCSGYGGDGMYNLEEVKHILWFIKENGLEAIQLVQTIGHMEFALKHPAFQTLREMPRSPAVLCPSKPESQVFVRAMLEQVLDIQPDANYIHIGADEVWHTAICAQCQRRAAINEHKIASLYLDHIRDLTIYLKQKRPNLTVLIWDDMLRSISIDTLKSYQLGHLIEPVLWHYNPKQTFQIDPTLWNTYRQIFPKVWVASAFKGASGSSRILSPVAHYVSNQEAWIQEIKKYSPHINFAGIILTGWSRYDHYATLCELMPVSLPSLASCLRILLKTDDTPTETLVSDTLLPAEWAGEQFARRVHALTALRDACAALLHSEPVLTWLNTWQREKRYTNPLQVEGIMINVQILHTELMSVKNDLVTLFQEITGPRSTDEWMNTFVAPIERQMTELREAAEARCSADASIVPLTC